MVIASKWWAIQTRDKKYFLLFIIYLLLFIAFINDTSIFFFYLKTSISVEMVKGEILILLLLRLETKSKWTLLFLGIKIVNRVCTNRMWEQRFGFPDILHCGFTYVHMDDVKRLMSFMNWKIIMSCNAKKWTRSNICDKSPHGGEVNVSEHFWEVVIWRKIKYHWTFLGSHLIKVKRKWEQHIEFSLQLMQLQQTDTWFQWWLDGIAGSENTLIRGRFDFTIIW